jgi:hypothetical protein
MLGGLKGKPNQFLKMLTNNLGDCFPELMILNRGCTMQMNELACSWREIQGFGSPLSFWVIFLSFLEQL